jgi:hypothetical protein
MSNNKASLAQDLTRALNLTLRPGRVAVVALGLLIGVAAAILFFWLGGLIKPEALSWLSWIFQRLGGVIFAYVVLASMCSAVAMVHAETAGEKIGVPAGWAAIARNIAPAFLGTVKPIVVFIGLIAIMWLVGALGAIPEVGPILWGIVSVVPLAAGLLAIFTIVKVFLVGFLFPAVLSDKKEKGTACYKESVRLIKGHTAHLLGRVAVAVLVCVVFYKIILAGFALTASQSSKTMGKNRATLRGSRLFEYVVGIPGIAGSAPRGLGVENPTLPFEDASYTGRDRLFKRTMIPFITLTGVPAEQMAAFPAGLKMKATQKVGGWIFSIVLIVVSVVLFAVPFLFFTLSGYCAYLSFKDAPELALRTEAVDWSEIKETAQEIAGKRKAEPEKKPAEKKSS